MDPRRAPAALVRGRQAGPPGMHWRLDGAGGPRDPLVVAHDDVLPLRVFVAAHDVLGPDVRVHKALGLFFGELQDSFSFLAERDLDGGRELLEGPVREIADHDGLRGPVNLRAWR